MSTEHIFKIVEKAIKVPGKTKVIDISNNGIMRLKILGTLTYIKRNYTNKEELMKIINMTNRTKEAGESTKDTNMTSETRMKKHEQTKTTRNEQSIVCPANKENSEFIIYPIRLLY